jgi:penicillin G amidase
VSRLRRIATVVAAVLVLVLVLGTVVTVWGVRRPFPDTEGSVDVPGLSGEVRVARDEYGVPQVYADTPEDLFFGQGYVQAQDRFFQMDFRRHVTAGRLSELFGREALQADVFVRTLGWRDVAEREYALLDADTRSYLEAFSAGVNAYLARREGGDLALEYTVLGLGGLDYAPEEWTPVDSLAWLKAMAWDLRSNMQDEIDRTLMSSALSEDEIADLYPPYPRDRHAPIVPDGGVVGGAFRPSAGRAAARPSRVALSPAVVEHLRGLRRVSADLPRLLGTGSGIGSNAWAVSGRRTNTGEPLLANDPHLAPSIPGIWYQMGLHCNDVGPQCPFDVSGFTFAGLPGVVVGHNRRIAWGLTNLPADVTDLYVERVGDGTYRYDGRDLPLRTRFESFAVAGGQEVNVTVRSTRHGPLVSDVDAELGRVAGLAGERVGADVDEETGGERLAVALRWTALTPSRTAEALFGINTAGSWREFRAAARDFAVPTQNLVYADVDGHIGYQAPGQIPIRRIGTGDWPVPGWDPAYEWADDFVPFRALPYALDPERGYVVAANQAVTDASYPYHLGDSWAYGYRSERLTELITRELSFTVEEMAAVQADSRNGNASVLLPYLLDLTLGSRYVRQGQRVLRDWDDLQQPADSAAAAFFNIVWRNLLAATFHDQVPEEVWPNGDDRWFEVVRRLLRDPRSNWWDNELTDNRQETRDDILSLAMSRARFEITRRQARDPQLWTWGHLHQLELVHESLGTSGNGVVERLFNRGPYEVGGGESVVNATGWTAPRGYAVDWVPSMRMVVSLSDLDASRWVNLTGASGHPFNSHYNDQFGLWRDGDTTAWPFSAAAVDSATVDEMTLVPRRRGGAGD